MKLRHIAILNVVGSGVFLWGTLTALDIWLGVDVGTARAAEKAFLSVFLAVHILWLTAMLDMWKGEE